MNKVKILFIISDLERGGPELRLLDFAKHFASDIKMYICVTSQEVALLKDFEKYNIDIKIIPIKRSYLEINKIREIYTYINKNQISIVNSIDMKGLIVSLCLKKLGDPDLKIVHHTLDTLYYYKARQKFLLWLALKFTDASICNSIRGKNILQKNYTSESKIKVIYNGVDTEYCDRSNCQDTGLRKRLNINEDDIVLGTIANFRKEKNYPFLINAYRLLLKDNNNLKLLCVGGGGEFEKIKGMVRECGLENNVVFTSYSSNIVELLCIMDIFALCSLTEGFPNVIIQAMNMKVPVIASAVDGCAEIINNLENGILFEVNNTEMFIRSVNSLIENKALVSKIVENAKIKVTCNYSLELMIKNYSDFYKNIYRAYA